MKKPIPINFVLHPKIYPVSVMVSFGENDEQMKKSLRKIDAHNKDEKLWWYETETCVGRAVLFDNLKGLIRLRTLPKSAREFGALAHEIFHLTAYIMYTVGTPLEVKVSDESYAYLLGWLTTEIYQHMNKGYK